MGYGNPKTISDTSVKNCAGDIREFKPTILVGVPAVWETIKKGVMAKVGKMNAITKNLFWASMASKSMMMSHSGLPFTGLGASVIDSVVFSKVKDATGGRLRICLNGGGPVAKDTQRFISMVIAPMISGYGLTETTAMGALTDPLSWTDEALGGCPASIEIKLVDFEDAGYFSTNEPPQGEIWIRGGSVTEGYLDNEQENKEAFTEDGWFKTGDIGEFDKDGNLKIIDRKKNLVKTLNGEYIALEKVCYNSLPPQNKSYISPLTIYPSSSQSTARPQSSATSASTPPKTRTSPLQSSSPPSQPSRLWQAKTASRATVSKTSASTRNSTRLSSRTCKHRARRVVSAASKSSRVSCSPTKNGPHRTASSLRRRSSTGKESWKSTRRRSTLLMGLEFTYRHLLSSPTFFSPLLLLLFFPPFLLRINILTNAKTFGPREN